MGSIFSQVSKNYQNIRRLVSVVSYPSDPHIRAFVAALGPQLTRASSTDLYQWGILQPLLIKERLTHLSLAIHRHEWMTDRWLMSSPDGAFRSLRQLELDVEEALALAALKVVAAATGNVEDLSIRITESEGRPPTLTSLLAGLSEVCHANKLTLRFLNASVARWNPVDDLIDLINSKTGHIDFRQADQNFRSRFVVGLYGFRSYHESLWAQLCSRHASQTAPLKISSWSIEMLFRLCWPQPCSEAILEARRRFDLEPTFLAAPIAPLVKEWLGRCAEGSVPRDFAAQAFSLSRSLGYSIPDFQVPSLLHYLKAAIACDNAWLALVDEEVLHQLLDDQDWLIAYKVDVGVYLTESSLVAKLIGAPHVLLRVLERADPNVALDARAYSRSLFKTLIFQHLQCTSPEIPESILSYFFTVLSRNPDRIRATLIPIFFASDPHPRLFESPFILANLIKVSLAESETQRRLFQRIVRQPNWWAHVSSALTFFDFDTNSRLLNESTRTKLALPLWEACLLSFREDSIVEALQHLVKLFPRIPTEVFEFSRGSKAIPCRAPEGLIRSVIALLSKQLLV